MLGFLIHKHFTWTFHWVQIFWNLQRNKLICKNEITTYELASTVFCLRQLFSPEWIDFWEWKWPGVAKILAPIDQTGIHLKKQECWVHKTNGLTYHTIGSACRSNTQLTRTFFCIWRIWRWWEDFLPENGIFKYVLLHSYCNFIALALTWKWWVVAFLASHSVLVASYVAFSTQLGTANSWHASWT